MCGVVQCEPFFLFYVCESWQEGRAVHVSSPSLSPQNTTNARCSHWARGSRVTYSDNYMIKLWSYMVTDLYANSEWTRGSVCRGQNIMSSDGCGVIVRRWAGRWLCSYFGKHPVCFHEQYIYIILLSSLCCTYIYIYIYI